MKEDVRYCFRCDVKWVNGVPVVDRFCAAGGTLDVCSECYVEIQSILSQKAAESVDDAFERNNHYAKD